MNNLNTNLKILPYATSTYMYNLVVFTKYSYRIESLNIGLCGHAQTKVRKTKCS